MKVLSIKEPFATLIKDKEKKMGKYGQGLSGLMQYVSKQCKKPY